VLWFLLTLMNSK